MSGDPHRVGQHSEPLLECRSTAFLRTYPLLQFCIRHLRFPYVSFACYQVPSATEPALEPLVAIRCVHVVEVFVVVCSQLFIFCDKYDSLKIVFDSASPLSNQPTMTATTSRRERHAHAIRRTCATIHGAPPVCSAVQQI